MPFSPPTRRWLESGRFAHLEGHQVFFQDRGHGPALFLIHGMPTSSYDWRGVMERLQGHFRCVALDLPGFGLSDKPLAYSYSLFQQADVVESLAHHLGIEDAHVLSHDVGTSIHTELLARRDEGRLALEILSSTFLNGSILKSMARLVEFQRIMESPATLDQAIAVCESMPETYISGLQEYMHRPDVISEEDATVMREVFEHADGHRRLPFVYSYVRERYLHSGRWVEAIEKDPGPLQFVWGAEDPVATPSMGRELARRAPRARYTELAGVGHFVPIEAPAEVAQLVTALASTPSVRREGAREVDRV